MDDTSCRFHTFKVVILLGHPGHNEKAKANTLKMEVTKERKVDEGSFAGAWMPSKSGAK